MEPGALGRRRRRGGAFSLARLFANGEAGAWYDPSDLTAEKVAWRRNLLTWSEDFTNAAWTKTRSSITPNAGTSWDGTATASKLVEDTSTNTHILQFVNVSVGGTVGDTTPYCFSVYAKAAERTAISLFDNGQSGAGSGNSSFDLSAGTVISGTGQIVAAGGGWYRCIIFPSRTAGTLATPQVRLLGPPGNVNSYTGDGTSGVLLDSAQLEASPTVTAYQRITDFTSDFLAAFPTHALYQDAAGTTPVTALGQPVGLVIDSKTGGLANLGPELVTNGDFSGGTTGWTLGTGWAVGGGVATYTPGGGLTAIQQNISITAGKTYLVTITVVSNSGSGSTTIYLGSSNIINGNYLPAGRYQFITSAVSGTPAIYVYGRDTQSPVVDNISVREVPGVHAIQPTNSSRPLLDGRVNLLERTEEFDNAYWTKTRSSVTANAAIAPDGTTTADKLVEDNTTGTHIAVRIVTLSAASYTFSVFAKADQRSWISFLNNSLVLSSANFNLAAGTLGTVSANASASITNVGGGWFRCAVTWTTPAGANELLIRLGTADATPSYAGDGTSGAFLWGADLRLATDAAYPYQRVAAATDYADVGVPRSFLFDGFDDSLYTASNMDLSGTDKVTVLAGVRKLSDAATGIAVELTSSSNVNTGSFALLAPSTGGANSYRFLSHGTGISTAGSGVFAAAPDISVLTGIADIAGDVCSLRRNGAVVVTSATDQGTGNYSSAVLFIGRRNNTSDPFNGKAYQLIVRGALTEGNALRSGEVFVGQKTGVAL